MERCSSCGLAIERGDAGCQALFEQLLGRDFSDARYFRVHRTLVDTYCLQHPDRYCVSAKSLAAHLCGLCWAMESGGGLERGPEALQRWLNGQPKLDKPELPGSRGDRTIGDVRDAPDPVAYAAAVERWARATWEAHRSLHALARDWLERGGAPGDDPRRAGLDDGKGRRGKQLRK